MDLSSWSPSALLVAPLHTLVLDGSSVAQGAPPSPTELLRQTQDTYDSLRSYSSAGEVTSTFSPAGLEPQQFTHSFTMRLARPALYRIEWEQRSANFLMKGAAWSTGEGHFVIGPGQARPDRVKDVSTALSMATGISGGAANTIPGTFFGLGHGPLKALSDAVLGHEEAIEGDPCYLVSGRVAKIGTTLWISKTSKLLRQIRHDFEGPMEMPKIKDDDLRKSLESMNREATDEAVATMKAQMESARKMMSQGMHGFSIEVHRDITVNPPLTPADFAHTVAIEGK